MIKQFKHRGERKGFIQPDRAKKIEYIRLGKGKYDNSLEFRGINGELILIDFDKKRKVLGIDFVR